MPDSEMLDELNLDDTIKGWSKPEQFLARNVWNMRKDMEAVTKKTKSHDKRITRIEMFLISSGILGGGGFGLFKWLGG